MRDPVDRLSRFPQIAQDVVTVDVDAHPQHKQKQTCTRTNGQQMTRLFVGFQGKTRRVHTSDWLR